MHFLDQIDATQLNDYLLPCYTKQTLGFDCPGCGLQRAILLLLRGEFMAAFEMYPPIYVLIPLAFVLILKPLWHFKYAEKLTIALSILSVAVILINYIFKLIF